MTQQRIKKGEWQPTQISVAESSVEHQAPWWSLGKQAIVGKAVRLEELFSQQSRWPEVQSTQRIISEEDLTRGRDLKNCFSKNKNATFVLENSINLLAK